MDLGGSGNLHVLVYSVAVGPVIHEPKTRPSLSKAQLTERFLLHHGSLKQVLRCRRVSNRWPVNNHLKEDQQYHYQCSDSEQT